MRVMSHVGTSVKRRPALDSVLLVHCHTLCVDQMPHTTQLHRSRTMNANIASNTITEIASEARADAHGSLHYVFVCTLACSVSAVKICTVCSQYALHMEQ